MNDVNLAAINWCCPVCGRGVISAVGGSHRLCGDCGSSWEDCGDSIARNIADRKPAASMAKFATRPDFVAWATDLDGHTRFAVMQEFPGSGYHWLRLVIHEFTVTEIVRSQGCFYDGVPEHPEGALEWAKAAAGAAWTKTKAMLAEI